MLDNIPVFISDFSLVTPLGFGIKENFENLLNGQSGLQILQDDRFFNEALPFSKIDDKIISDAQNQFNVNTRFDALLLKCANQLLQNCSIDLSSKDCLIILSTTKGNIELMASDAHDQRLYLGYSAALIQQHFNNPNKPLIISNACISGVSAMIVAKRLVETKKYHHVVVIGCDVLSHFVISGFHSFHALSKEICKPFDAQRNGINLGEACAALVISNENNSEISLHGGCVSNDANHISGPSKTGEELAYCVQTSLQNASLQAKDIDFISAHGTATEYNDEMESKAFDLSDVHTSPVFSLKAMYGHTLGASGLLEAIIAAECLKRNIILPSYGYSNKGVSGNIFVSDTLQHKPLKHAIKTGSGFGGCNAAIILSKV